MGLGLGFGLELGLGVGVGLGLGLGIFPHRAACASVARAGALAPGMKQP